MKQREVGDSGILVSPIGLGTVKLGRNQQVKYPEPFNIPDDRAAKALLNKARDLGINLIDTAPAYGTSEQRLGELLKGSRQHWVVCTKVGEEFIDGQSTFDFTPEHTIKSVERSLKNLKTDVLDIVLVHSDGNDIDIINRHGTLDALNDLKKKGWIRATGMSTKTVEGGLLAAEKSDLVMVTYNASTLTEEPVIDYALQHNKGVFVKKALNSGKSPTTTGTHIAQQNLSVVFKHPGVTSVIVGTINPEHLAENVRFVEEALAGR